MADHQRIDIQTKFGKVALIVTDANHIYVTNNPESGRNILPFVLRGIPYNVSAHFYRYKDGSWHLGEQSAQEYQRVYQALYLSRMDKPLGDAGGSARKTIYQELDAVVGAWAAQTQNTKLFSFAQHNKLEADLERLAYDKGEAEKALAAINRKIADVKRQLAK